MTYFRGYHGLGDNIFQRPFLKYYPGAYLRTPWPELYQDLNVKPVRTETRLRTQQKNETRSAVQWYPEPNEQHTNVGYGPQDFRVYGSIINTLRHQFNVTGPLQFDLPSYGQDPLRISGRVAVIRPVTVRAEWDSTSRGCNPEYICQAAELLRSRGFHVVSVADLEPGKEWIVGDTPKADTYYHHGELSITQLMSLIERADVVVTPVGWAVPASIAYQTPCFVVAGGRGGHNAPHVITDPDMNLQRVGWAIPDEYCMCTQAKHECSKHITDFTGKLTRWLNVNVG